MSRRRTTTTKGSSTDTDRDMTMVLAGAPTAAAVIVGCAANAVWSWSARANAIAAAHDVHSTTAIIASMLAMCGIAIMGNWHRLGVTVMTTGMVRLVVGTPDDIDVTWMSVGLVLLGLVMDLHERRHEGADRAASRRRLSAH